MFGLWRRSILVRLILTFMIIMVPLYGIGISMYFWGIEAIKKEISSAQEAQVAYYLDKISKEIQGLKLVQSDTLYNDDINMLANGEPYMNNYERGYYMNKLQQRLSAIKNGSVYVENVMAYIPSVRRMIPAEGSISELKPSDLQRMKMYDDSSPSQLIYADDHLFLNAFFPPNYIKNSSQPLYSVLVKLSSAQLKNSLSQFGLNEKSGSFLMDANRRPIVSNTGETSAQELIRERIGNEESGSGSVKIEGKPYMYIYRASPYLGLTVVSYIPENAFFAGLSKYKIWFWVLTAAAAFIVILFSLAIIRFLRAPLHKLIKGFKRLETGDMDFTIGHPFDDEFGVLYQRFNSMLVRLRALIDQNYNQTIMVQRAELKQLQAQINPHFLYNSFFLLYTMTRRGKYEELMKFQLQLGEYFRFLTRNDADEVTLEREVSHARAYCEIQALRFSNRIRVEFGELPAEYADLSVPRLILQPIVENAFQHGLELLEENGLLQVRFIPEKGGLRIEVANNGAPMSEEALRSLESGVTSNSAQREVTGMLNIHRRIRLRFGEGSGIRVDNGPEQVVVAIQLEFEDEGGQEVYVYAADRR
ncbi:sensor histidine kinase [Cohnella zeiphila]|nr:histidine kinase [Cohnella zeiphila]